MTVKTLPITIIVSEPDVRGGRPVIAGTRLTVADIVAYYIYGGLTPENLAVSFKLSLGQVHAALAYYFLNKAEIEAEMRQDAAQAEQAIEALAREGRALRFEWVS